MKLFVDFWKFTKIWKGLQHRNTKLFLFWLLDVQKNFMFPTCKNSQKEVKNRKSTYKHSSFDDLMQEDMDLSDIYLCSCMRLKWLERLGLSKRLGFIKLNDYKLIFSQFWSLFIQLIVHNWISPQLQDQMHLWPSWAAVWKGTFWKPVLVILA